MRLVAKVFILFKIEPLEGQPLGYILCKVVYLQEF